MHFESGVLKVDARGEFSLEEAKRAFLEMLEAVAQYQAAKVLFFTHSAGFRHVEETIVIPTLSGSISLYRASCSS